MEKYRENPEIQADIEATMERAKNKKANLSSPTIDSDDVVNSAKDSKAKEDTMAYKLVIDKQLHKQAKNIAIELDMSLHEVYIEAINRFIRRNSNLI